MKNKYNSGKVNEKNKKNLRNRERLKTYEDLSHLI
jgi:hypothetical protein